MNIFVKYSYIFMFIAIYAEASKATEDCRCIASTTLQEFSGIRYIARCTDAQGNKKGILLDTIVKSMGEAQQKTKSFMNSYQINPSDCYQLGNKMIYDPKSTK